ncbi:HAD family hydrolase [Deferribacter autotrophicus]|uniref:phosphoglycolate phosphatase n=1 Tax=Deferribacter autotrophicus TaxID=500465 RepID=A0A5A8F6C4_9BACT|nr:HAD family hydrolase [Deferribacter autotrophicus]KAA0257433.1 HAD family hydrolase [Deferribacter autotrophicus]
MRNKVIIFDLDGTLIDTLRDIHSSLMITLEEFGFPKFDINVTKSYVGDGIKKLVERAVGEKNYNKEIEKYFREIYNKKIIETSTKYEQIDYVLSNLKKITPYLFIISNKSFKFTDIIVKHFNLDIYFKEWFGGDSFEEKKPSPIPVLKIFKKYNISPDKNSFMIGDNYTDIESGFYAGVSTIYCSYGYGKLGNITPDYIVDSPVEILKIVQGG